MPAVSRRRRQGLASHRMVRQRYENLGEPAAQRVPPARGSAVLRLHRPYCAYGSEGRAIQHAGQHGRPRASARCARSSPWSPVTFTLACMNIPATWRTALCAGLWTGVGALLFEAFVLRGGVDPEQRMYYFFFGGIPFFWIPLYLFVFGSSAGSPIKRMFESAGRGLCWTCGAALVLIPGLPVIGRLYAS